MRKRSAKQKSGFRAVIYCRVSSVAQVLKGDGIGSQETACRAYAKAHGHDVVEVFKDEAISGAADKRPGMEAMLAYLRVATKKERHVIIVDDISRIARDIEVYINLRSIIKATGVELESPNFSFSDDSDGQFMEYLSALLAEYQRRKNTEQTKNRMKARLEAGHWPFSAPVAYKHV